MDFQNKNTEKQNYKDMNEKQQNKSVMLAVVAFALVVLVVGAIGYFTIGTAKEEIQGEIEVEEYRVASKVPGRILELCVKEGDSC